MANVVGTFYGCKRVQSFSDESGQRWDRPCGAFAQRGLELGKRLLDRIEVGRVGRRAPLVSIKGKTDSPLPSVPVQAIVDDEFGPAGVARNAKASDADIYRPSIAEFQSHSARTLRGS